jgi:hypothetical protein
MKKALRVNVTRRDIRQGLEANPSKCPVALAICRHKGLGRVAVGTSIVRIASRYYDLPKKAAKFIRSFDDDKRVKPVRFQITINQ